MLRLKRNKNADIQALLSVACLCGHILDHILDIEKCIASPARLYFKCTVWVTFSKKILLTQAYYNLCYN